MLLVKTKFCYGKGTCLTNALKKSLETNNSGVLSTSQGFVPRKEVSGIFCAMSALMESRTDEYENFPWDKKHLGQPLALIALVKDLLPREFNAWEIKCRDGLTIAHHAAINKPHLIKPGFKSWHLIENEKGWTVAHMYAWSQGCLPGWVSNKVLELKNWAGIAAKDIPLAANQR